LLAAEQSAEVTNEDEDDRALPPVGGQLLELSLPVVELDSGESRKRSRR
jgi:hypothetical protein